MKTKIVLIGAPTLWLAGWIVMRLGGHVGPNAGWAVAHSVWIVALGLFAAAARIIQGRALDVVRGRGSAVAVRTGYVMTVISAIAVIGQMGIDLTLGLISPDRAALDRHYDSVFAVPGVEWVLYNLAPLVFFTGLITLVIAATIRGAASPSAAAATVAGVLMSAIGKGAAGGFRLIEGVGYALVVTAMVIIAARSRRRPARLATAPETTDIAASPAA